jgi:hypothetical protein
MKPAKLGISLVIGALMVVFAGSAAYAQYPPTSVGPTTVPSSVPSVTAVAGETITFHGGQCPPGAAVKVTWDDGTLLASGTAGSSGTFAIAITIPQDATPGAHDVTATCGSVRQFLRVNVRAATVVNAPLARTGTSSITPLSAFGAAVVVLGGALILGARRVRATS